MWKKVDSKHGPAWQLNPAGQQPPRSQPLPNGGPQAAADGDRLDVRPQVGGSRAPFNYLGLPREMQSWVVKAVATRPEQLALLDTSNDLAKLLATHQPALIAQLVREAAKEVVEKKELMPRARALVEKTGVIDFSHLGANFTRPLSYVLEWLVYAKTTITSVNIQGLSEPWDVSFGNQLFSEGRELRRRIARALGQFAGLERLNTLNTDWFNLRYAPEMARHLESMQKLQWLAIASSLPAGLAGALQNKADLVHLHLEVDGTYQPGAVLPIKQQDGSYWAPLLASFATCAHLTSLHLMGYPWTANDLQALREALPTYENLRHLSLSLPNTPAQQKAGLAADDAKASASTPYGMEPTGLTELEIRGGGAQLQQLLPILIASPDLRRVRLDRNQADGQTEQYLQSLTHCRSIEDVDVRLRDASAEPYAILAALPRATPHIQRLSLRTQGSSYGDAVAPFYTMMAQLAEHTQIKALEIQDDPFDWLARPRHMPFRHLEPETLQPLSNLVFFRLMGNRLASSLDLDFLLESMPQLETLEVCTKTVHLRGNNNAGYPNIKTLILGTHEHQRINFDIDRFAGVKKLILSDFHFASQTLDSAIVAKRVTDLFISGPCPTRGYAFRRDSNGAEVKSGLVLDALIKITFFVKNNYKYDDMRDEDYEVDLSELVPTLDTWKKTLNEVHIILSAEIGASDRLEVTEALTSWQKEQPHIRCTITSSTSFTADWDNPKRA